MKSYLVLRVLVVAIDVSELQENSGFMKPLVSEMSESELLYVTYLFCYALLISLESIAVRMVP